MICFRIAPNSILEFETGLGWEYYKVLDFEPRARNGRTYLTLVKIDPEKEFKNEVPFSA